MANVVEWSPDDAGTLSAFVQTTRPTFTGTPIRREPDAPSFRETLTNMVKRENFALDAGRLISNRNEMVDAQGEDPLQERDPNWNPYRHVRETWDEATQQDMEFELRAGIFDDARNPAELALKLEAVRQEKAMLQNIEGGPISAQLLGGLVGGITDPTSYVPIAGQVNRLRRLGVIGKGLLIGATATAIPEFALQGSQELRTKYESFMNVGIGTALGGGAGAFVSVMNRRHALSPSNPHNPLREDNFVHQGDGFRTPEGEIDVVGGSDSAGAARVVDQGDTRHAPGLTTDTPFLGATMRGLDSFTPVGRAGQYSSPVSRGILRRLMDMGGRLSRANLDGTPTIHSAEDWKRDFMRLREIVLQTGDRLLRDLNRDLGQTATAHRLEAVPGLGRVFQGTVSAEDFSEIARQQLLGIFDDAAVQRVETTYGPDAAQRIVSKTSEYAEDIHRVNGEFEAELIDLGLLRDDNRIAQLTAERDAAREAVRAERERLASETEAATEAPDQSSLRELRADRERAEAALAEEAGKPAAMGRDYGHAQLWSPAHIMNRQEAFEDFLLEALAADPDDEWLTAGYGLTKGEFQKLGQEPVEVIIDGDQRTISIENGVDMRRTILRDWAGDEFEYNLQRAEAQEGAAQRGVEEAEWGLSMTMRALGWVTDKARRATATEIRAFRDRLAGQWEKARADRGAATARGRVRATPDEIRRLDRQAENAAERLQRLDQKLAEAQAKRTSLDNARQAVGDAKADAARELRVAQKDLRKALRKLRKANKSTPLANAVNEITRRLAQNDGLPSYQRIGEHADRIARETGRTKARRIHLSPEMRLKAEELGFLRTDLPNVLTVQYDQLSGWIGLHRGLDMGPNGRYATWADVVRAVDEDFEALRQQASGDAKTTSKLNDERRNVIRDMGILKDRLLGTENAGVDKDGWSYWLSKKMRQLNFVRFGAGFLLPSMTDIASVAARTGSIGRLVAQHGPQVVDIMRGMDKSDLQALVNAQELGANGVRMARAFDVEDGFEFMGIGAEGTTKHRVTSRIDTAMGWLTDKTNVVSGMRAWNRMNKIAAGIHRAYRLRDFAAKGWGNLLPRQRTDLAQLGIGESQLKRIGRFIEQHGSTDARGHWDPGLEDWASTREGREAARDFRIAIERDMSQAIFTPGIGDTPGLMSHALGKLWLQFQSYAFTFLNRYLSPTSQRIRAFRDPVAIASMGHLIWTSLLVVVGKGLIRGEDPSKRFEDGKMADTLFEMLDRSGMMHFMSPYVDALVKASAPMQEAAFGEVKVGPTSRFVRNDAWTSALGANFGLARDLGQFTTATIGGDVDRATEKALLLAPYNTYWRVMHQLVDD